MLLKPDVILGGAFRAPLWQDSSVTAIKVRNSGAILVTLIHNISLTLTVNYAVTSKVSSLSLPVKYSDTKKKIVS